MLAVIKFDPWLLSAFVTLTTIGSAQTLRGVNWGNTNYQVLPRCGTGICPADTKRLVGTAVRSVLNSDRRLNEQYDLVSIEYDATWAISQPVDSTHIDPIAKAAIDGVIDNAALNGQEIHFVPILWPVSGVVVNPAYVENGTDCATMKRYITNRIQTLANAVTPAGNRWGTVIKHWTVANEVLGVINRTATDFTNIQYASHPLM